MSEVIDKAAEKLLESIGKSQTSETKSLTGKDTSVKAAGKPKQEPVARKRVSKSVKPKAQASTENETEIHSFTGRKQFIGNMRWPD
ncbi:MAG: hypothetical protein OEZ58_04565 [Gammaproteobacteria bacterium]|nr:hypothetical protein [Gammaproteobacteria bacterium]MDH5728238.1 hypothetical protein [Gammaproteobacteria bacterium]